MAPSESTTPARMMVRGPRSGDSQPVTTLSAPTEREPSANAVKEELEAEIADQQRQIEQLRSALEEQKKLLERTLRAGADESTSSSPMQVSGRNGSCYGDGSQFSRHHLRCRPAPQEKNGRRGSSPLQLRIGSAFITPVGFIGFLRAYIAAIDDGSRYRDNFAAYLTATSWGII